MDDPKARLNAAVKDAMLAKDNQRRDALRTILSAIKQVEIDTRKEITAEDVVAILQKEVKKRRESLEEAQKLKRDDLVAKEQYEINLIEEFLPGQLSRDQIVALAQEAIAQTGATSAKEMGKVMGVLMPRVKGVADGKLVNEVVRELLDS